MVPLVSRRRSCPLLMLNSAMYPLAVSSLGATTAASVCPLGETADSITLALGSLTSVGGASPPKVAPTAYLERTNCFVV